MGRSAASVVAIAPETRGSRVSGALRSIGIQLLALEGLIMLATLVVIHLANDAIPGARSLLQVAVAGTLGAYASASLLEAIAAVRSPTPPPVPAEPRPSVTGIVVAYLPNESGIILETLEHHLSVGPDDLQLIVAYNTPHPMPVEDELHALADRDPRLLVLRVAESGSKAENVNAAVEAATGGIIGIFDSDHLPDPGGYDRAWRWLARDADVVQGRCIVRRPDRARHPVTVMITAEFEQMYTVGHAGRSRLYGFGLFGGSNGYWRVDALRAITFDPSALTEDIDASVQLLRSGGRIVTDPAITSSELAPPSFGALCHQRLRWAQGWFQVRLRHLAAALDDGSIPARSRFGLGWMFGLGSMVPWIGALVLPLWVDGWTDPARSSAADIVRPLLVFGTLAFLAQIVVAYRHATRGSRRPHLFGAYLVANAVFYAYLRVALVRLAHLHEFAGRTVWRVTPRS